MDILVIGSGGREHALCWKLRQSPRCGKLYCAPGNAGTGQFAENVALGVTDLEGLVDFAETRGIGLTVVGPEVPLCAGVVDAFQARGLRIFGPNQSAARLEGSKTFSKELLLRYRLPTARAGMFCNLKDALEFSRSLGYPQVVKASGLAAGKGVVIAGGREEAEGTLRDMLSGNAFGEAGLAVVVEEFLVGEEASLHLLVSGRRYALLPGSQDHKRVGDGDTGLNTGGMGAYSPTPVLDASVVSRLETDIIQPLLAAFEQEGLDYRGVLYVGLMMTASGPKVLEFNCRFGDPETQVILPMLQGDLIDLAEMVIDGTLDPAKVQISSGAAVCVVMAAEGYPGLCRTGDVVEGLDDAEKITGLPVFHGGTALRGDGAVVTSGGRVLGVASTGNDLKGAVAQAYQACERVRFAGAHYRRDIAARGLARLSSGRADA
jgi:phosphoribosylamine--glycine ligase